MPQKRKPNGFDLFAKEKFLDADEVDTMSEARNRAHGAWMNLSANQKEEYKLRAKLLSGPQQSACPECLRLWKESGAKTAWCKRCIDAGPRVNA